MNKSNIDSIKSVMFFVIVSASLSFAQADRIVEIWPEDFPGLKGTAADEIVVQRGKDISDRSFRNIHIPALEIFQADKNIATGAAVVICPGGGYGSLAYDKEGVEVAKWLNSFGVSGFVLKYRLREYGHPAPLFDLQRAIRTVRHNAYAWNVDKNKVGILGFSAGGHLVTTGATHFDYGNSNSVDPVNRQSCRPDFLVAVYPVVSLLDGVTHGGSRRNLLGPDPSDELVRSLSNELKVEKDIPPTFLVHTTEDTAVPVENSIRFYLALIKKSVPAEMHIYQKGRHGYGLRPANGHVAADWPGRCQKWLKEINIIK